VRNDPSTPCPLLDFKVVADNANGYQPPEGYEIYQSKLNDGVGSSVRTYVKRGSPANENEAFIVNLGANFNGAPCISPNNTNQRKNNEIFPQGCGKYGVNVQGAAISQEIEETTFLMSNMLNSAFPKKFEQFLKTQQDKYNLVSQLALRLAEDPSCRGRDYYGSAEKLQGVFYGLLSILNDCSLAVFAFSLIGMLVVVYTVAKPDNNNRVLSLIAGVIVILSCIVWIVQYFSINKTKGEQRGYLSILDDSCVKDERYDVFLNDLQRNGLDNANYFLFSAKFMGIAALVIGLICSVVMYLYWKGGQSDYSKQRDDEGIEAGGWIRGE
jgi:hypothetical protein